MRVTTDYCDHCGMVLSKPNTSFYSIARTTGTMTMKDRSIVKTIDLCSACDGLFQELYEGFMKVTKS